MAMRIRRSGLAGPAAALLAGSTLLSAVPAAAQAVKLAPGAMPAVAKVDERFQSYNVEMAEVIGGRFWAPYKKPGEASAGPSGGVDMAAAMFRQRTPLDLRGSHRLRVLAKALGPAYVRIGGAWANTAYFQDDDQPAMAKPPAGYQGVLTRAQWAGVVDFAKATDAAIVTSFGVGPGSRGADGVWKPDNARQLVAYTHSLGGSIYAAELINEPNIGQMVGLPKGYTPETFARDQAVFRAFLKSDTPQTKSIGPVSTGEAGYNLFGNLPGHVSTDELMAATPKPTFDIFAYHFYGASSKRCSGKSGGIAPEDALSEQWLARADEVFAYYKARRDKFAPGTPIWITEMAEASCGGDAWAATFLDTFRYVDQMGRLAKKNVQAIFHNTLAASDYALIDDETWEPRPSYWAAVLWRRIMGETVLDAGANTGELHLYAQCLRDRPGGVGLVAINLSRTDKASLTLPNAAQRYTLSADELQSKTVKLNGNALAMLAGDRLPNLTPALAAKGTLSLAPASITFLAMPGAGNNACR
jgi:hypothetical protein